MPKLSEILHQRGYVHQFSASTLEEITDEAKRTVYLGIDPSADSLHVGNLQAMLVLRRFLEDGHRVVLLIGGGTGMIGDPSGKSEERNLLDDDTIARNSAGIESQARGLFGGLDFEMVNNADWLRPVNLLEFLRDIGKHFSVNAMLQRDSVKNRIESQDQGISYTEFSYMLLQSYDYLHLHTKNGVDLQIGASDQWGNIASGIDLVRRKTGNTVYGFTSPLLINKSTGKKFGKSEEGAVWLDPRKTTPLAFYQFFLNVDDAAVDELLLKMTVLSESELEEVRAADAHNPAGRARQKKLAHQVTHMVHGAEEAAKAESISAALFGSFVSISPETAVYMKEEAPSFKVFDGMNIVDVLAGSGLASSKREAKQFLSDGAVILNDKKADESTTVAFADMINGIALVRRGKRHACVLIQ